VKIACGEGTSLSPHAHIDYYVDTTHLHVHRATRATGARREGMRDYFLRAASRFSTGFSTWKEHINVSSTDIMAPELSNSPQ